MSNPPIRAVDPGLSFPAFVALIAAMNAVNALGVDSMLAALPEIGREVGVQSENARQWIIAVYVFGFGAMQIVYGPLADRYGRRPILLTGLCLYALCSIVAGLATSFPALIAARLLQGMAAAAARVLAVSIVRDCYTGRQMARVMSLSFIVFLAVPILAPSIGQLILLFARWRWIFFSLALFGGVVALVAATRLNETLHPEYRRSASFVEVLKAMATVIRQRNAIGYTLASTLAFGALMGFINSIQQIFADIFQRPALFPILFACMAASMGVAAFVNSRIVERVGTRMVSHSAALGFMAMGGLHSLIALAGFETIVTFAVMQCLTLFCFGLMGANFNSMAMEKVGAIAGTASSVQGFISTCGGAVIGLVIGQAFDGTTIPLSLGFFVLGACAVLTVLWTERGRLFHAQHMVTA